MKILCCGIFPALQRTLELKNLKPGAVNRVRSVTRSVGGKATNAARVLKTLGADPLLFGFAGGENGEAIRRLLNQEDIEHALVETEAETRVCQTLLAGDADDFTELVEDTPPLPARDWKTLLKAFVGFENGFDRIIFSGTLPAHAPVDIYAELIAATDPARVILDTSGAPLLAALEHRPALIKINTDELAKTLKTPAEGSGPTKSTTVGRVPSPGALVDMAQELIAQGAGAVGITNGAEPALLVTPNKTTRFAIPEVNVASTLGCGDSVNAGIAFSLAKGNPLKEAFVFGLACGASNAMNRMPGVIDPEQIAKLAQQIQIS
jgi:1-phosphofructokinase family hexose kinase